MRNAVETAKLAPSNEVNEFSLDELFAQYDEFVANRSYLVEDSEPSLDELFAQYDEFVANRPYLVEE